jgi:hypothetical protein
MTIGGETSASAALGVAIDARRSSSGARVAGIDDEIPRIASRGMPRESRDVTIDPLAMPIGAQDVPGASLGLPRASPEVIDRCQGVPSAAQPENCAAQSDIFGALLSSSEALGTFREPRFARSASQEATRAALFTPSASVVTPRAALGVATGGARGTERGARRSSCGAGRRGRVDRGTERRGRRSSGGSRRDLRLDRRSERRSSAKSRGAECAACGALDPNAMPSRGVAGA